MKLSEEIYRGGFYALMQDFEKKQRPFRNAAKILPPADVDLAGLSTLTVAAPTAAPEAFAKFDSRGKRAALQADLQGESELALLHAICIAILRRTDPPQNALTLFLRMWQEQGAFLADTLSLRWKISAATTFADHGVTPAQRALGMGLSVLFDSMKIHESERSLSGQLGRRPFRRSEDRQRHRLAFDLTPYSFKTGDLDRNMLARLWNLGEQDATIAPLARAMLLQIMNDDRSIFARLQRLKGVRRTDRSD